MDSQGLNFIIGEEKSLSDLLCPSEIDSVLKAAIATGVQFAQLTDAASGTTWHQPPDGTPAPTAQKKTQLIYSEGEPIGTLLLAGADNTPIDSILQLLVTTIQLLIRSSFQRQLTTEVHTTTVAQSYAELMSSHEKLKQSEQEYRDLAASLDTTVKQRTAELERTYMQLIQNEKMSCVGQLAAGVAHEINTPMGFITSNLSTLQKYIQRLLTMQDALERRLTTCEGLDLTEMLALKKQLKIDYIRDDAAALIDQSIEGAQRISSIVSDLKNFSHVDNINNSSLNLNDELDRTLAVLASKLPASATIKKAYQPLPSQSLPAAAISQVLFNILLNAIEAGGEQLQLILSTAQTATQIIIAIHDNGSGIPADILPHIFEPFFTTKEVGQGTGMGLALARQTIQQLGGQLELECPASGGSVATIRLPLESCNE